MPVQKNLPGGTFLLFISNTSRPTPCSTSRALLLLEDHLQLDDLEVFQQLCSLKSKDMLVAMVMDGLATDYLMTSWDPDFSRWF